MSTPYDVGKKKQGIMRGHGGLTRNFFSNRQTAG